MNEVQWAGVGDPSTTVDRATWGGVPSERINRLAFDLFNHDRLPTGFATYQEVAEHGYFKAQDAADGTWLWVLPGEMVPYTGSTQAEPTQQEVIDSLMLRIAALEELVKRLADIHVA